MTLKHTPGQWVARLDPNAYLQDGWCVGVEDNIDEVAVCSEKDAHLIAAAPDLLDALQRLLNAEHDEYLTPHGLRNLARAAIAKATNTF